MQTLLSEHWHAVRFLRPRLRESVQPMHRRLRGKSWVLLFDPLTQRFHRMTPQVWRVLQLLDGRRTLDEVWDATCEQAAAMLAGGPQDDVAPLASEDTISQHELVQLMSSLHANDLLQTQVSPDAGEVFDRFQRQQRTKRRQSWLNPISIRVPMLYPDSWFEGQAKLARAIFQWPALLLWLAVVLPASVLAWQHWGALTENLSDRVLSASNVVLLWLTYPLVKAVHEWAHGLAVKAWGGTVREMGLMFIVFMPVPYVDATSSYRFPSKWARATVAAAGIMAELVLGSVAVYVWLMAEPGWVTAVAFNVILIAGVSTVLVNGNPLMRYDGYFIACDLLELPNLALRATQYWAYLIDRYGFGAKEAHPPAGIDGERFILAIYGAVAPVYRLLISIGLIWFVATEYLFVGAIMAVMAGWSVLVMPLWKGWKHLSEGSGLVRRRESAMRRTLAVLSALAALIGFVPLPFHSVQQGVVWLPDEAIVRAEVAGHVAQVLHQSGGSVRAGNVMLRLESPQLSSDAGLAAASVAQVQAKLRKAEVEDQLQAAALRHELASRQARLDDAVRRSSAMEVRAGAAGRWTPAAPTDLVGRYAKRGEVLGHVVDGPSRLVRVAVVQEDRDLINSRLRAVQVRLQNQPDVLHQARVNRWVPGGEFELISSALGTEGGGSIPVDPSQAGGQRSLKRVFDVEVELDDPSAVTVFGDRAHIRFDLGLAPLGWQWFLRLRQAFLSSLEV